MVPRNLESDSLDSVDGEAPVELQEHDPDLVAVDGPGGQVEELPELEPLDLRRGAPLGLLGGPLGELEEGDHAALGRHVLESGSPLEEVDGRESSALLDGNDVGHLLFVHGTSLLGT